MFGRTAAISPLEIPMSIRPSRPWPGSSTCPPLTSRSYGMRHHPSAPSVRPAPTSGISCVAMNRHVVVSAQDALGDIFEGAMVAVGGFGPIKNRPVDLLMALADQPRARNLTIVSNGFPHQPLAENRQVKKLIAAFGGSVYRRAAASEEQIRSGELEFEPSPQGIFTERLRAGAGGIAAFFSPVGVDTVVATGKERRTIDGRDYILETALKPDFGLARAEKSDLLGNLSGTGSTLNFHT